MGMTTLLLHSDEHFACRSPLSSISEARNQAIKTARKLTKIPQWHGNGENRKSVRPIQALPTKNPVASELQTSEK